MKRNAIGIIMGTAALAIIALIILQAKWMYKSRQLIEEQFNQKVRLALCRAMDMTGVEKDCSDLQATCTASATTNCVSKIDADLLTPELDDAIRNSLIFYDINLDYEIQIFDEVSWENKVLPPNGCSLASFTDGNQQYLTLTFPRKEAYFFERIGIMLTASILIILFITTVFVLTIYAFVKQKRITEINKDFFNNMAHEFRTPLTNISLATKLLTRKQEELRNDKYIALIGKESKQLMHQVNGVLDFAKMEKGGYTLKKEAIDLGALIEEVIRAFELRINECQAKVTIHAASGPTIVTGDRLHLSNIFKNLLDNALKNCEKAPQITIGLQQKKSGVALCFKDNGIGIKPTDQPYIFDRFFRSSNHFGKGFGIGLAYVKKIIELHRGSIKVLSEVGAGTQFNLFLPGQ